MAENKSKKSIGTILFALVFGAVGFGVLLFSVIPSLYEGVKMSDWPETQATVSSSELHSYSGDSTTYEATGRYRYRVAGNDYTGSRLGISSSSDNIGNWHQRMAGRLKAARSSGNTITVFYNPDNHAEAIVDPSPRWGLLGFKMIFVMVFGGVGIGLIYWSRREQNRIIDTPEAQTKPWLGHKDWAQATVLSTAKTTQYGAWAMAIFWNLISWPLLLLIPREFDKGNLAVLLVALFPAVGLGLMIWAIKLSRRWRAIGATPLALDPYPGSIGGQVGGSIETNIRYSSSHRFPVTLSCVHSYMSGSGKDRKRQESVKWNVEGFAEAQPHGRGSRLVFRFDVPAGLSPSQPKAERYHLWRLNLKSEGAAVDMNRNFELPVFATEQISTHIDADSSSNRLAQEQRDARIDAVMHMQQTADGVELFFPAGRNVGLNGSIAAFGCLFIASGIGAGYLGAPILFPIIFSLIGLGLAAGGLYSLLNSLRVRIGKKDVQTQRTLCGVIISKSSALVTEVRKLRIHKTGSMSSGTEHKVFYAVRAHLRSGKKITLAESLIGQGAAGEVAEALAFYSGIELDTAVVTASQLRAERKQAARGNKPRGKR